MDNIGEDKVYKNGDLILLSTKDFHIHINDLDERLLRFDTEAVIFMSRHSSASGEPALTVHPIGNYHDADFGGNPKQLVKAAPGLMSDALRKINEYCNLPEFRVCYEVTHHGPYLDKPTFFMEIGSDDRNWGNLPAAEILAKVLMNVKSENYLTAIGIGGGHYAPRFTEVALKYKLDFGHMIPNYQLENRDDEDILRMMDEASKATGAKTVYLHKKSLKKPLEHHITDLAVSLGLEVVSSADLEEINGI